MFVLILVLQIIIGIISIFCFWMSNVAYDTYGEDIRPVKILRHIALILFLVFCIIFFIMLITQGIQWHMILTGILYTCCMISTYVEYVLISKIKNGK